MTIFSDNPHDRRIERFMTAIPNFSPEQVRAVLDKLDRQTRRADAIVERVRAYAKRGSRSRTVFSLESVVRRAVADLAASGRFRARIVTEVRAGDSSISVAASRNRNRRSKPHQKRARSVGTTTLDRGSVRHRHDRRLGGPGGTRRSRQRRGARRGNARTHTGFPLFHENGRPRTRSFHRARNRRKSRRTPCLRASARRRIACTSDDSARTAYDPRLVLFVGFVF